MNHRSGRLLVLGAIMVALFLSCCSAPIPREDVPADWALNVHQPGEWWTEPLIPRSVVVQRCPPPRLWGSDPDLTQVTGLPPGSSVNYFFLTDDYHCPIGWSEPESTLESAVGVDERQTEAGLRRICSTSGLPMDASWRFLGTKAVDHLVDPDSTDDVDLYGFDTTTVGFIDQYDTVVACIVQSQAGGAFVELSVGADLAESPAVPPCPVVASVFSVADNDTVGTYEVRGAGAVRDARGRALTRAKTLRIGLVGDSVQSSHPVVDGIAIVAAQVTPKAAIHLNRDDPPPVEFRFSTRRARSWPPAVRECRSRAQPTVRCQTAATTTSSSSPTSTPETMSRRTRGFTPPG